MSPILFLFAIIVLVPYLIVIIYLIFLIYATFSGAPFVPTGKRRVDKMIEMANLKPTDRVIDLGSGDGRVTIAASKQCAKSVGVEINPFLCWLSKIKAGRKSNVEFKNESLWKINLADFDLIFIYFIPHRMKKLAKKIRREMKPGSRIVSHAFIFPDWQYLEKNDNIYLYEVNK